MKRTICLLMVLLHLVGCTTLSTVPYSRGAFEKDPVRPGDRVVLLTKVSEYRFQVSSVTPTEICGVAECVRTEAIESVQLQEFSALKTVALVGLTLAVFGLAAVIVRPPVFPG